MKLNPYTKKYLFKFIFKLNLITFKKAYAIHKKDSSPFNPVMYFGDESHMEFL